MTTSIMQSQGATMPPSSLVSQDEDSDNCKNSLSSTNSESDHEPIKCSAVTVEERLGSVNDPNYTLLLDKLRQLVLKEVQENPGIFKDEDVERCRSEDWYLGRFLLKQNLNVKLALNMVRRTMRANHDSFHNYLRPVNFPVEFYQIGGLFPYEPDRKGNRTLYIRVKTHKKAPELNAVFQSYIHHNIKMVDDASKGKGFVLVLDCAGGGVANADMDLLLFLVNSLINQFPRGLSYILVHDLPWILKPFWYISRAWIPDEQKDLIKFSNQRTIYEYIDKENLPDFMGGTCTRDYRKAPQDCSNIPETSKLLGIEPIMVKKLMKKFAEHLPPGALTKIDEYYKKSEDEETSDSGQEDDP